MKTKLPINHNIFSRRFLFQRKYFESMRIFVCSNFYSSSIVVSSRFQLHIGVLFAAIGFILFVFFSLFFSLHIFIYCLFFFSIQAAIVSVANSRTSSMNELSNEWTSICVRSFIAWHYCDEINSRFCVGFRIFDVVAVVSVRPDSFFTLLWRSVYEMVRIISVE